jgi:hypothetical protein
VTAVIVACGYIAAAIAYGSWLGRRLRDRRKP